MKTAETLLIITGALVLIETILVHFFHEMIYDTGIPLFTRTIEVPLPGEAIKTDTVYSKDEGKYKFISRKKCLFTSKMHFFSFFRINSMIPLKSSAVWDHKRATVYHRVPLAHGLFYGAIFYFLSNTRFEGEESLNIVFPVLLAVFMVISFFLERSRAVTREKELAKILQEAEETD